MRPQRDWFKRLHQGQASFRKIVRDVCRVADRPIEMRENQDGTFSARPADGDRP